MNQTGEELRKVLEELSLLEPTVKDTPRPAAQALVEVKQRIEQRHYNSLFSRLKRSLAISRRKHAFAALLTVVMVSFAFSFPAIRAAASDFLGLFRVQKFAAISVSPEQIAILQRIAESGLTPGEFEILQEPGSLMPVDSLSKATALSGVVVRELADLGEPEEIYVTDGGKGQLIIDLAGARAILEATGVDAALLPDNLDGRRVEVVIFAGVEQRWPDDFWLVQTESPLVEYPEGLDPALLGQALLQVLGMNADEAARLAQNIDWTSTLLLPIPQDFASFSEVTVGGVSGLALTSLDGDRSVIMWQQEGIIYLLNGPGSTGELVSLANSLR